MVCCYSLTHLDEETQYSFLSKETMIKSLLESQGMLGMGKMLISLNSHLIITSFCVWLD